tara:strand:+ start:211 stop:438 length:228 start_codon:yes stop_codon:yes gene_type:complete
MDYFTKDEKDILFLSLNDIIKNYKKWNNLGTSDKYDFLSSYKKLAKNDNSKFNIYYKLNDILTDHYGEDLRLFNW